MYALDQSIVISTDNIQVDWKITPGPMLAGTLWDSADLNHDGIISPQEAETWVGPYISQWQARVDSQPLQPAALKGIQFPAKIDDLQTGAVPIDVVLEFSLPQNLSGSHLVEFHDSFQESISLNWYSIKSDTGVTFDAPEQTNGQITTHVNFTAASGSSNSTSSGLSTWDSGMPTVPGLTGVVSNLAISLSNSQNNPSPANTQPATGASQAQALSNAQGQTPANTLGQVANPATAALTSLMKTQTFTPLFLAGAFLLSLALGSLHALTPGHGKTLVAAYLVGSHGKTRDAIFLGSIVTLTHTGSVLLLGLATLIVSRYILPTLIIPWLEILSGLFVIIFGVNLLVRRGKHLLDRPKNRGKFGQFKSIEVSPRFQRQGTLAQNPISAIVNSAPAHTHEVLSDNHEHHGHTHTHSIPAERVTWRSLLALGISGGLVPCPDAIAILFVAVSINRIPFGMLLIVAFSLGLALVLIGIGIAMVQGVRLLQRNDLFSRFSLYSPVASAIVVVGLGIALTVSAINTAPAYAGTPQAASTSTSQANAIVSTPTAPATPSPQATASTFNLDHARILYIAPDENNFYQLFEISTLGENPIKLTDEASGIQEYSLSPDKQTILYSTLKSNGDTSLWMMHNDGSERRMLLDCPTAVCRAPVWSPDGQKLIYERQDYSQSSNLGLSTLWWLDLKTGETKPVFRDQDFPGFAAAFSPDGRWLSYISPSNNSIQMISLVGDQSRSIPYWSGYPEKWSPAEDSFLYWDLDTQNQQSDPQLKRYDLTTGKSNDLSGTLGQEDYPAVWSPDGQWVAIARNNLSSTNPGYNQQVWLVRPDGSQAHIFLNPDGYNYSDIAWTPDSQWLVYSRYSVQDKGKEEVWIANIKTGQEKEIVSGGSLLNIVP